jgi:hypothetical protein
METLIIFRMTLAIILGLTSGTLALSGSSDWGWFLFGAVVIGWVTATETSIREDD